MNVDKQLMYQRLQHQKCQVDMNMQTWVVVDDDDVDVHVVGIMLVVNVDYCCLGHSWMMVVVLVQDMDHKMLYIHKVVVVVLQLLLLLVAPYHTWLDILETTYALVYHIP